MKLSQSWKIACSQNWNVLKEFQDEIFEIHQQVFIIQPFFLYSQILACFFSFIHRSWIFNSWKSSISFQHLFTHSNNCLYTCFCFSSFFYSCYYEFIVASSISTSNLWKFVWVWKQLHTFTVWRVTTATYQWIYVKNFLFENQVKNWTPLYGK